MTLPTERRKVLLVCKGNICRSPAAEVILRKRASDHFVVRSRGTRGWHEGKGAHPMMVTAADKHGYDLRPHVAHQITANDLNWADTVIAMDAETLSALSAQFGASEVGHARLLSSSGSDVPDPFGATSNEFDECLATLEQEIDIFIRGSTRMPASLIKL